MKIDIINIDGQSTGKQVDLPEDIFGVEPNEHAVYLAVKLHLANKRQGTHKAKERGEIKGSTKKIKRQKGTGTARAGDIKNPLFRGGGRAFGPRPRTYDMKVNKKVRALARKSACSDKQPQGNIVGVEDFTFEAPKTKEFKGILDKLEVLNKKSVLVTSDTDKHLYLSSRNLPKASVTRASDFNTYEIVKAQTLVLSEGAIEQIKATFAK